VQIPCIERNVQAAACALVSEKIASASDEKRIFSFDEIIKVMLCFVNRLRGLIVKLDNNLRKEKRTPPNK
jgi:hypothetical protein